MEYENDTPEWDEQESDTPKGCLEYFVSIIKTIWFLLLVLVFVFGGGAQKVLDLFTGNNGYTDRDYISMVQDHCPFDNGDSYYEAFDKTFDHNEWKTFETANGRMVQVISSFNDIPNETMITQFSVTPAEQEGYFIIEPYAMRVSGQDLNTYDMNIILATVFEDDVINALGELILYSSLYQ